MKKLLGVVLTISGMACADTISTPAANTVVSMLPNATYAADTSLGNAPFFNNFTSDLSGLGNAGYFLTDTGAFTGGAITPPTGYLGQVSNNNAAALSFALVRQATSINVSVLYQDAPQTNANQGSIQSGTTIGIYDVSNPSLKYQIFGPGGVTTGATVNNFSTAAIGGSGAYGFYATVCQPGFGLSNCYTFYSDTSLNPAVSNGAPGGFALEGPSNVHQHFALFTLASGGFYVAFENSVSNTSFDGLGGPEHYGTFDAVILGIDTGASGVPEPATLSMMGLGLLSLGFMGRRLRKR